MSASQFAKVIAESTSTHSEWSLIDGNNVVNVQDATLIQRYLAEYEVEYSIGESI